MMTIDGRQFASAGATTGDVGSWLKHFGAYTGINMDGGGSTTMAWWNPNNAGSDKSELLNYPVGTGWGFRRERTVGSNFGVYYSTGPSQPGDFDGDGNVTGLDLIEWQLGGSPNPLSAADLDDWRAQFGTTTAAATAIAVPEPTAGLLLVQVMAAMFLGRRWAARASL